MSDPSFVIDASVAIAGLSPDEANAEAGVVVDRALASGCHVPAIWPFEVENILALKARRSPITAEDYARARQVLRDFRPTIDHHDIFASIAAARPLAETYNLAIYDAVYLELARRLRLPLATLNRPLAAAATQAGAALLLTP